MSDLFCSYQSFQPFISYLQQNLFVLQSGGGKQKKSDIFLKIKKKVLKTFLQLSLVSFTLRVGKTGF